MSRKGENIFKRSDGRWEARYIHHYENGKAKYRFLYGNSYTEVKAKKLAELSQPDNQRLPIVKQIITFEQLANAWLADTCVSVKESTYTRYYHNVTKYLCPQIGQMCLVKIDTLTFNQMTKRLLESGNRNGGSLSPKTVSDILCVLKLIFRFGQSNGYPCASVDGIRQPKQTAHNVKILSDASRYVIESLLTCEDNKTNLGIVFTLFTGVRIGELCGLRWGDIDFDKKSVRICRTVERIADLNPNTKNKTKVVLTEPKTSSAMRVIPLPGFLVEYLRRQRKTDNIYILTGKTKYTEPHSFYMRYRNLMGKFNMDEYTFHALRHTFATKCVEEGFDTKSLSEILGHSNVATTLRRYVHPTLEQKRRQMELLTPMSIRSRN